MNSWDYLSLAWDSFILDDMGNKGWELCGILNMPPELPIFYFKRPGIEIQAIMQEPPIVKSKKQTGV